ncbi:MAG: hypothetical protein U5K37_06760 [Natrialbaceae archaeon]|nr:hypothetical protein [Natrialbaceae archaeon]
MGGPDLETVASRTRILLETAPPADTADLRTTVVEPLLQALGWPVRGSAIASDIQLGGSSVEYVLSIDEVPALFVAVDCEIDEDRTASLIKLVTDGSVNQGLYIDAEQVLVLGAPEPESVPLRALDENEEILAACRRSGVADRLVHSDRKRAVQRISQEREALVDDISTALTDRAGEAIEETFRRTAVAFVDRLVDVLQSQPVETSPPDESPPASTDGTESSPPPDDLEDEDGEFVAKFFDGPTSIGAVGDSTSVGAFVSAVEYLLEGQISNVRPPWPAEGPVILNDEPRQRSGEHMAAAREIREDVYLEAGGTVADRAERLETLAAQAGLRVMFTGDW